MKPRIRIALDEVPSLCAFTLSRFAIGIILLISPGLISSLGRNPAVKAGQAEPEKRGLSLRSTGESQTAAFNSIEHRPKLVLQTGHTSGVHALAFSPDARLLVSGSGDNTIKLWDTGTRRELRTLSCRTGETGGSTEKAALSPDGRMLAIPVRGDIKLLEVASGRELRTLLGFDEKFVEVVAFSPDARLLAAMNWENSIKLWDVASGRELRTLTGHTNRVRAIVFSPDGRWLVSGGDDKTIKVWEVATGRETNTLIGHGNSIIAINISLDGRWLASASWDRTVKIWQLSTGQEVRSFNESKISINSIAVSPDGHWLAMGRGRPRTIIETQILTKNIENLSGKTTTLETGAIRYEEIDSKKLKRLQQEMYAALKKEGEWTIKVWNLTTGQKPQILAGHTDGIETVAFSPDGRWLASGSGDTTVKVWDTASWRESRTLSGHTKGVGVAAFTPDGRCLVSGSSDKTVKVWDVAAGGSEMRTITCRTRGAECLTGGSAAMSPDGRLLAMATQGNDSAGIKLWEVATGRELRNISGGGRVGSVVTFSPDSRWLALGESETSYSSDGRSITGVSGQIRICDVATGAEVRRINAHSNRINAVAFSNTGRLLVSASSDNTVKIWDPFTGRELRTVRPESGSLNAIAISRNGQWLATASSDRTIRLWDTATGQELRTLIGHEGQVNAVAFSGDGLWIASGGSDKTVRIWDSASGRELRTITGHSDSIRALAISSDSRWVASGCSDNTVRLWDSLTGKEVRAFGAYTSAMDAVAFSPNGRWLTSKSRKGGVTHMWEIATGRELRRLPGYQRGSDVSAISPDGALLATNHDRSIKIRDTATSQEVRILDGHTKPVTAMAFSPDSRWLASAGSDDTIRLWSTATGQEAHTLVGHPRWTSVVVFSPDGRWLASAGMDKTIKLWEVETGREVRAISGHVRPPLASHIVPAGGISSLAFSPDGQRLAVGGGDRAVTVWEVSTGRELLRLGGNAINSDVVGFCLDGRSLVSLSKYLSQARIDVWDLASGRQLRGLPVEHAIVRGVAVSPDGRSLATRSESGVELWDIEAGELLATLLSVRDSDEWIVVTPDGLFDGSPTSMDRILWRFGENIFDVVPIEAFFNEFYYPGLLTDILAGKRPKGPRDISQLDRRQPSVNLALASTSAEQVNRASGPGDISARTVTVNIEVAEAPADKDHKSGSGARDVRLFRNGSMVRVWRGDVLEGKGARAVLEATIPIIAGENRLTIYGFNRDNIKSPDATLIVTGSQSLQRAGTAYILVAGINQYANPQYNLKYAVADARAFAEELRRQQVKLATFAKIEVIALLDREATKANILEALKRLAGTFAGTSPSPVPIALQKIKPSQPEDAVIVYFAGHGIAQQSRFYLIPHDLGYSGDRAELNEASLKTILAHSISDVELEQAFEKVDAPHLLLVIDACNSGQALEAEEKRRGPMNSKGLAQLAYEKGMYILTAAQGYQAALEVAQLGHGLLTYSLVEEGLKTAAADSAPKDNQVVLREWLNYATMRVPQMQEAKMKEARELKHKIAFVEGEEDVEDDEKRNLQRPRVFYRREPDSQPLVVARP